ncbi:MAG: hypothetical protein HYS98_05270 [Deltaproteobacteria bacterium]|nr:hypothetical protein [Deltaproteobacteria bacterium]
MRRYSILLLCCVFFPIFSMGIPLRFHSMEPARAVNHTSIGKTDESVLEISVQVRNALTNEVIPGAYVLLHRDNQIFKELSGYANDQGIFSAWVKEAQKFDITILKKNFSLYSILDARPARTTIYLEPRYREVADSIELKGQFYGWPVMTDDDGIIDAGIIVPFISLGDLLDFEFERLFMPPTKGKDGRDIPGNIVFPKQSDTKWGYPVTIDHSEFTLQLEKNKKTNLVSLMGTLSLKDIVSVILLGKEKVTLLNSLNFTKIKLIENFSADKNISNPFGRTEPHLLDKLQASLDIQFNNAPPNRDIIAISAGNPDKDVKEFYLTGFKKISRNDPLKRVKLSKAPHTEVPNFVVAMAADLPEDSEESKKREMAASGMIQRENQQHVFAESLQINSFFKMLSQSVSDDEEVFQFSDVENPRISPSASLAVSHINYVIYRDKDRKSRSLSKLWTLIKPASRSKFRLPHLPTDVGVDLPQPKKTKIDDALQWEESVFSVSDESGNKIEYHSIDDSVFRKGVSHFSRNSIIYEQ